MREDEIMSNELRPVAREEADNAFRTLGLVTTHNAAAIVDREQRMREMLYAAHRQFDEGTLDVLRVVCANLRGFAIANAVHADLYRGSIEMLSKRIVALEQQLG